jgi:hypothetical protein
MLWQCMFALSLISMMKLETLELSGTSIAKRRNPKSCSCQVFDSKLGCFTKCIQIMACANTVESRLGKLGTGFALLAKVCPCLGRIDKHCMARDACVIHAASSRDENSAQVTSREYWMGKYHCTVDLLFDWFRISCMTTEIFCFYLQNRLIQTSQTGGQRYIDTSPFSIPWFRHSHQGPVS